MSGKRLRRFLSASLLRLIGYATGTQVLIPRGVEV